MTDKKDLHKPEVPTWCPGCGDFGIWTAFKSAARKEGWDNSNSVVVAGIGCHGHIVNFVDLTSFEGLHGRPLPVASGIKMANHRLNVVVFSGDGDSLAEGGNHFLHTTRRNHDITLILHDNAVYGLTTGQTSPASPLGYKSKSTPEGNIDEPLHPVMLALMAGATFVARAYSGNIPQLSELMIKAVNHKGFAVLDVLQPCVTWNKVYTHTFYSQNVYDLGEDHNPKDKRAALMKAMEWVDERAFDKEANREQLRNEGAQIPLGVLYEVDEPSCEEQLQALEENTRPIVERKSGKRDVSELFNMLM